MQRVLVVLVVVLAVAVGVLGVTVVDLRKRVQDLAAAPSPRDPDNITEADEAWYLAVKRVIDAKRRAEEQQEKLLRDIHGLARRGDIQPFAKDKQKRDAVEKIVGDYAAAADGILTRYFRNPTPEAKAMDPAQRRNALQEDRHTLIESARRALTPILGEKDAQTIASQVLSAGGR